MDPALTLSPSRSLTLSPSLSLSPLALFPLAELAIVADHLSSSSPARMPSWNDGDESSDDSMGGNLMDMEYFVSLILLLSVII